MATTSHSQTTARMTRFNPWMITLGAGALLIGQWGWTSTTSNADPSELSYDPGAAAAGPPMLIIAGVLLTGLLVAGAVRWHR